MLRAVVFGCGLTFTVKLPLQLVQVVRVRGKQIGVHTDQKCTYMAFSSWLQIWSMPFPPPTLSFSLYPQQGREMSVALSVLYFSHQCFSDALSVCIICRKKTQTKPAYSKSWSYRKEFFKRYCLGRSKEGSDWPLSCKTVMKGTSRKWEIFHLTALISDTPAPSTHNKWF